jgi:hypothetical protein
MYAGSSTILPAFQSFKHQLVIEAAAPVHSTLVKGYPTDPKNERQRK